MTRSNFTIICVVSFTISLTGQNHGFEFGKVSYDELNMEVYDRDTAAVAVVLDEFGEAFFDSEDLNKIIFQYHTKIKILKEEGKSYGNFEIPLRKLGSSRQEILTEIKASSFNIEGNTWTEKKLQGNDIFTDKIIKEFSLVKFAIPDVRKGSVIELFYQLETPFTYNFVTWEFQSEIPKNKSEFWGKYPGYYQYNSTLKGYLTLTRNQADLVNKCVKIGSGPIEAGADCVLLKYAMKNIPAFVSEDHMTSKKNFLSSINFELSQITQLDGRIDKITKEWKDVEKELRQHESFGSQIKKAGKLLESKVKEISMNENNEMEIAKKLYEYVKNTFSWNGELSKYTDQGVKKLIETKKGNIAEINLALLGALIKVGIDADAVLISTRDNGVPIKSYPVLSDFNYVLVRLIFNNQTYLLDATNPLYPFGFVPEKCLNGQGRVIGNNSEWIDIKPSGKNQAEYNFQITLDKDGNPNSKITITHLGYSAFKMRSAFLSASDKEHFIKERSNKWLGFSVKTYSIENESELSEPFIEKIEGMYEMQEGGEIFYFEPLLIDRVEKNPFNSNERKYPVDYATPVQSKLKISIGYPANHFNTEDLPQKISIDLPLNGGGYKFEAVDDSNKVTILSELTLNKSIYTSYEYNALKNLYSNYITSLRSQIVFKKTN